MGTEIIGITNTNSLDMFDSLRIFRSENIQRARRKTNASNAVICKRITFDYFVIILVEFS